MYSLKLKNKCQLLVLDYVPFTRKLVSNYDKENKYGKSMLWKTSMAKFISQICLCKEVLIKLMLFQKIISVL